MSPLRTFTEYLERDHPNVLIIAVISLLLLNTLVGAIAIYKVTEQQNTLQDQQQQLHKNQQQFQEQARQFAHIQCTSSNDARKSLKDLLVFIEARTVANIKAQGGTPDEIQGTKDFYHDAIARVHFTECPSS